MTLWTKGAGPTQLRTRPSPVTRVSGGTSGLGTSPAESGQEGRDEVGDSMQSKQQEQGCNGPAEAPGSGIPAPKVPFSTDPS